LRNCTQSSYTKSQSSCSSWGCQISLLHPRWQARKTLDLKIQVSPQKPPNLFSFLTSPTGVVLKNRWTRGGNTPLAARWRHFALYFHMEQLGRLLKIGIISLASPSLRSHGLRPSILRRSLKNELFIPASEEDARARSVATPAPFYYYFNKPYFCMIFHGTFLTSYITTSDGF